MSTNVNPGRAENIKTLQQATAAMGNHKQGTAQHTIANAIYQVIFNRLSHQGEHSNEILHHAGFDTRNHTGADTK